LQGWSLSGIGAFPAGRPFTIVDLATGSTHQHSVRKYTRLTERFGLDLRGEFCNFTNTPNAGRSRTCRPGG
jgi:hypothetical protein